MAISDVSSLGGGYKNKQFFCATFPRDDIRLSDEHSEYAFVPIEKIEEMQGLEPYYKKAILKCLNLEESVSKKIKIIIG